MFCYFYQFFFSHFFHCFAHNRNFFLIFFEISNTICQDFIPHILGIGIGKIMHQFSQCRFIFNFWVHIYNLWFITMDILVSINPDSGNMETDIPEQKPPLNCQSVSLSPDCMDTETGIFNHQIIYLFLLLNPMVPDTNLVNFTDEAL